MVDVAPLNYERWAVIVSPLEVPGAQGGMYAVPLRHLEQLTQVSASLDNVDSRKKESLVEQAVKPPEARRKVPKPKPAPPPSPTTSHPAEWLLRQPLPMEVLASARNQSALDPRKITELYRPPESTPGSNVRVSG